MQASIRFNAKEKTRKTFGWNKKKYTFATQLMAR